MSIRNKVAAAALAIVASTMLFACSAGKPSQEEVRGGYEKILAETSTAGLDVPPEAMDKMLDCIVPKAYEQLSDKALNALAKGDPNGGISGEDQTKLQQIGADCGKELAAEMLKDVG